MVIIYNIFLFIDTQKVVPLFEKKIVESGIKTPQPKSPKIAGIVVLYSKWLQLQKKSSNGQNGCMTC